jgi:thiamine pyrophosphokinase
MKTNKKVFLLLNGETPANLPNLTPYDLICVTDGGFYKLKKFGVVPDLITGDFDSSANHPSTIEVIHTPNQDYTDFEKMLQILYDKGYKIVDVYGASGKEQDHFLGNLHTALIWKDRLNLTFYDNYGYYFFAKENTTIIKVKGKIISLYPFPKAEQITTNGLQYSLDNETLEIGKRIGTRNIAIKDKIVITFKKGNLIVFVN